MAGARTHRRADLSTGVTLPYVEQGDPAGTAVVLLHGPTDSWRAFVPLLAHLPASIRAVAPTQRGHADAGRPARGYRPADFAADAAALMDALEIERAVLLGHSGSCVWARRFARAFPNRTSGLILVADPGSLRDVPAFAALLETVRSLRDPIDPEFVREFVAGTASGVPADVLDAAVDEALKLPARVWDATLRGLLDGDDHPGDAPLAGPALLIWGERDELVGRASQEQLLSSIREAHLLALPDAGHSPHWEMPERCATEIARFSQRHA